MSIIAFAAYFAGRWLWAAHERAAIAPTVCITLLVHFAHRFDERTDGGLMSVPSQTAKPAVRGKERNARKNVAESSFLESLSRDSAIVVRLALDSPMDIVNASQTSQDAEVRAVQLIRWGSVDEVLMQQRALR